MKQPGHWEMGTIPIPKGLLITFLFLLLSHTPEYRVLKGTNLPLPEKTVEQDYINPVSLKVDLAGNFGEIRPGHFHTGIDIRTKGTRGWPIFAVKSGYISRIKVKATGFGNTLYMAHPDGYTSVYAHLKRFTPSIQQFVKKVQYRKQSYEVDIRPNRDKFRFEQGDTIAFSGNSGSSQGPHLHFEIRQTANQKPVNPLRNGFDVEDKKPPVIAGFGVYDFHRDSKTNTYQRVGDRFFYTTKRKTYRVDYQEPIPVCQHFGIAVSTHDLLRRYSRQMGVYSIRLYLDDSLIYEHEMDKISFSHVRYVNAHIDYSSKVRRGVEYQRCFVLPGNELPIYESTVNRGIMRLNDREPHDIRVEVEDDQGKVSRLVTTIRQKETCEKHLRPKKRKPLKIFHYDRQNRIKKEGIQVNMPGGALYNSIYLTYQQEQKDQQEIFAPVHHIHQGTTPVHRYYTLRIKPNGLPDSLRDKAIIAQTHYQGYLSSEGGQWEDGYVESLVREFGKFTVAIDTTAPEIRFLNIYDGKNMQHRREIRLTIRDNLSGIDSYRGTIDGSWVLMEYDAKYHLLEYQFDERVGPGEHTLRIEVTDQKDNTAVRQIQFER